MRLVLVGFLLLLACGTSGELDAPRRFRLRVDVIQGAVSVEVSGVVFDGELRAEDGHGPNLPLRGEMSPTDAFQPPVWASPTIELLSSGSHEGSVHLTTLDEAGEPHCSGVRRIAVFPASDPSDYDMDMDTVFVCALPEPRPRPPAGSVDPELGDLLVTGNLCPQQLVLAATATEVAVGELVPLLAGAVDPEQEELTFEWHSEGASVSGAPGSFALRCDTPGAQSVRMTVSDGDPYCDKSRTIELVCTQP